MPYRYMSPPTKASGPGRQSDKQSSKDNTYMRRTATTTKERVLSWNNITAGPTQSIRVTLNLPSLMDQTHLAEVRRE